MSKAKKPYVSIGTIFGTIGFVAIGIFCYLFHNIAIATSQPTQELQPYFSYSADETQDLKQLSSIKEISQAEIDQWIQIVFDLVKKNQKEVDATRVYAYLFTAQQDAAALSYQSKAKLMGNLTEVSKRTLCLLLPHECSLIPPMDEPDAYSLKVAEIVLKKVNKRLNEETKAYAVIPPSLPPQDWPQDRQYFGKDFGFQIPWLISRGNQFRPNEPTAYGNEQIQLQKEELQNILSAITEDQLQAAKKWAEGAGTILISGQWLKLANTYMKENQTPLPRSFVVRSLLAMSIADATIALFDSKYTYWKKRPGRLFPDLKTNLKTPNSPSYPSDHATISMAAAIVMDHYFPENQREWDKTANEIRKSRLWGGVHFPIDEHDGAELGRKIGEWIVSKIKN